jgi:oligo-1,6-glucosidase
MAFQQNTTGSNLNYYKEMTALRKKNKILVYDDYECLVFEKLFIYMYSRKNKNTRFLILHNFSHDTINSNSNLKTKEFELIKTNISSLETDPGFKMHP